MKIISLFPKTGHLQEGKHKQRKMCSLSQLEVVAFDATKGVNHYFHSLVFQQSLQYSQMTNCKYIILVVEYNRIADRLGLHKEKLRWDSNLRLQICDVW